MEDFKKNWTEVEQMLNQKFGKIPNLEAILFLVGIQESGQLRRKFTKEQKQDLMHVAVCALLSKSGYYFLESHDSDGWPHYTELMPVPPMNMEQQENFLKTHIIDYFREDNHIASLEPTDK
ncbi:MAG TPA: hypothetical protein VNE41_07125 [Chitinophagaceae bacterium]|nr:hypothetical protein [Chitinophagaceae bacterium]